MLAFQGVHALLGRRTCPSATLAEMIQTLEQAVLTELAAEGPIPMELRALAKDRARRVESALMEVRIDIRTVAARIAKMVREEHADGVKVRA